MQILYEGKSIIVKLPEKISAETIAEVDAGLKGLEIPEDTQEIVLDAEKLQYISSIGLRSILSLVKGNPDKVKVTNASNEVYEIFDITGFINMIKVERALEFIDTEKLEILGAGMYGSVYRINREQILKVFNGENSRDRLAKVSADTSTALIHGVPTIIPFGTVRTDKGLGLIFELLDSDTFANRIHKHPDKISKYAHDMAELIRDLAKADFDEGNPSEYKDMLRAELSDSQLVLSEEQIAFLEKYLDAVPEASGGVHGDFHAKNIMILDDELLLIDMDDFGRGHPIWDIASAYRGYQFCANMSKDLSLRLFDLPEELPYEDFFSKIFQINIEEANEMWKLFIKDLLNDVAEDKREGYLKLSKCYSEYMTIRFIVDQCKAANYPPERLEVKKQIVAELIENMKEMDVADIPGILAV